ncbi:MAG: aspartate-semialdehyde dehydrogenase, partial [Patescibacteria group bacterium]
MNSKLKIGILGATGTVGQKFIVLLQNHPWFEIAALGASKESAGKRYGDLMENPAKGGASRWKQNIDVPLAVAKMKISSCDPKLFKKEGCSLVFSGLDADVAKEIEKSFAVAGFAVVSNAKNWRMEPDVPLLVPEVNPDHIKIIPLQQAKRKWSGFIVTNPNCVAVPLVMALKPIHQKLGVSKIMVTSMQAISGAGYPGVPSLDILDNVIPMIGGEEPKVETEPLKLLGELKKNGIKFTNIKISAQCNRVPTRDGHFLTVAFSTRK